MLTWLKKGNRSAATAAAGNFIIALSKGIAAFVSGSGSMLATTVHSVADTLNQLFVFFGSILAEKEPTRRFPAGFGRTVNLFVLIAVMIIGIMAYETIKEGWNLIQNPHPSEHILINASVLVIAILIDGYVLWKAMKEIVREAREEASGLGIIKSSITHVGLASPPTRLVFYEDIIATLSSLLALIAVLVSSWTGIYMLDGLGAIIIGILLTGIAIKIGYENTVGLIGVAAPKMIQERVAHIILDDPDVVDIHRMRILQEGRQYHVESYIELRKGLSLAAADDIKFRVMEKVLNDPDIDDVTMGILESDGKRDWTEEKN